MSPGKTQRNVDIRDMPVLTPIGEADIAVVEQRILSVNPAYFHTRNMLQKGSLMKRWYRPPGMERDPTRHFVKASEEILGGS
jgi:hypothetical protein